MPRTFRFRLEAVAQLRQRREDACRRTLAVRLGQIRKVEQRLAELRTQLHEGAEQFRSFAAPHAEAGASAELAPRLRSHRFYTGQLQRLIADHEAVRADQQARLAQERAALIDAAKDVKALDKLRQRQQARHDQRVQRSDAAVHDELALIQHSRSVRTADGGERGA